MGLWPGIGIEPGLIGLEVGPIQEAGMVIGNENRPLLHREVTHSLFDNTAVIDVAFAPALTVGVSASIHRISQDTVDGCVGRRDPADGARSTRRCRLQRQGQAFGAKPEPDSSSRAKFSEALENG